MSEQSAKNPAGKATRVCEIYVETKNGIKRYKSIERAIRGIVRGSIYSAAFPAESPACGWIVVLPDVHNDYMVDVLLTDINPLINRSFAATPPIRVSAKALLDSVLGRW